MTQVPDRTMLPDPDAARETIRQSVPLMAPGVAAQAYAWAEIVQPYAQRSLWGLRDLEEPRKLARRIIDRGWADTTWHRLAGFYPVDHGDAAPQWAYLEPLRKLADIGESSYYGYEARDVRELMRGIHAGLLNVGTHMQQPMPLPTALPTLHPPKFARLRDTASAESATEELTLVVTNGLRHYQRCLADPANCWRETGVRTRLRNEFEASLKYFLTHDVIGRYISMTVGFDRIEKNAFGIGQYESEQDKADRVAYQEFAAHTHPRVYTAYFAIAVSYLTEVLELMPSYAEASGQGKPRDPVTVFGNVGAINSHVSHSNMPVAHTVTTIGATIETINESQAAEIAATIGVVAQVIARAPEYSEHQRAELLDHASEVAEFAAAPGERRGLSRAKAALAAITAAAGTSSELAQSISTVHDVFGKLF